MKRGREEGKKPLKKEGINGRRSSTVTRESGEGKRETSGRAKTEKMVEGDGEQVFKRMGTKKAEKFYV